MSPGTIVSYMGQYGQVYGRVMRVDGPFLLVADLGCPSLTTFWTASRCEIVGAEALARLGKYGRSDGGTR